MNYKKTIKDLKELNNQLKGQYRDEQNRNYCLQCKIDKSEKEKQELIEYLKEKKNELYKKLSDYNDLARIGKETDIEFFEALILERKIDVYEEILSKIEKRDK